jgi:hypothetical protein
MLSPKEKAEELVEAFMNIKQQKLSDYSIIYHPTAKQCALIAVNEILDAINEWDHYWEQVKQEIEQL